MSTSITVQPTEDEIATLEREETFALTRAVLDASRIVTHVQVDADAAASVVLAQLLRDIHRVPYAKVNFVMGNIRTFGKDTLALDIGDARGLRSALGGGMMIKASAAGGSCCMAMLRLLPEYEQSLLRPYITEISVSDELGASTAFRMSKKYRIWQNEDDRVALTQTSTAYQFQTQRRLLTDRRMYENEFAAIFGRLQMGDERRSALKIKDPWKNVDVMFNRRFAALPVGTSNNHAHLLETLGVEVTFHTRRLSLTGAWSLGFHRSKTASSALDFTQLFGFLRGEFPDICITPFFVGWGSKGGGLHCTAEEMQVIRHKLLKHIEVHLGAWYAALKH